MSSKGDEEDATTQAMKDLFEETLLLAEEDGDATQSLAAFSIFIKDMLPLEMLEQIQSLAGGEDVEALLGDVYAERYGDADEEESAKSTSGRGGGGEEEHYEEDREEEEEQGKFALECSICERGGHGGNVRLTRHHVYPKETHKSCLKRGITEQQLTKTIVVCRLCHNAVHRFFTNTQLALERYTLELLMEDEKMIR